MTTDSPVGWDADPVVAARSALPPLTADLTADVCVVGLGGSGLAAVGAALDRGLSVVGVDAGRVGAGAAGRNGGILTPTPGIGYARAAQAWGMATLAAFHAAASAEIDSLAATLGPGVVRSTGGLRLIDAPWARRPDPVDEVSDSAAEWADAADQVRVLRELGVATENYDGPLGRGVFMPGEAAMNPARRVIGLAEMLAHPVGRLAGFDGTPGPALYENSPVTSIDRTAVRTRHGSVSAGLIMVAVDGRLGALLPELSERVRTVRLQMLATDPVAPGLLPCPVHLRWGFDYAQQDVDGRLFFGGGRDRTPDTEFTDQTDPTPPVQDWIEGQVTRLAGERVRVSHRWAASAGYTDDGLPTLARPRPGLVAFGGYCGTGNIVGMLAAKAALQWALDGTAPPAWFASTW